MEERAGFFGSTNKPPPGDESLPRAPLPPTLDLTVGRIDGKLCLVLTTMEEMPPGSRLEVDIWHPRIAGKVQINVSAGGGARGYHAEAYPTVELAGVTHDKMRLKTIALP